MVQGQHDNNARCLGLEAALQAGGSGSEGRMKFARHVSLSFVVASRQWRRLKKDKDVGGGKDRFGRDARTADWNGTCGMQLRLNARDQALRAAQ